MPKGGLLPRNRQDMQWDEVLQIVFLQPAKTAF
jgi:hypothetical protein